MKNRGVVFALALILCLSFAVATYTVHTQVVSVTEQTSNFYNITINNTAVEANANITQVNISLPSGFTFTANTIASTSANTSLVNTSTTASWTNVSGLIMNVTNGTTFRFNATANTTTIGLFNISITIVNNTGVSRFNVSVTVNDTSAPYNLSFIDPTHGDYANISRNYVRINVSALDNNNSGVIRVYLFNASYSLVNNTNVTGSTTSLNISVSSDGLYYYNATANDTTGNQNLTGTGTRAIVLDTAAPTVGLTINDADTDLDTISFAVTASEGGTGISGTCGVDNSRVTVSGSGSTSQTVVEDGLTCGTAYSYTVTCVDYAGNSGSQTATFSTDSCVSSGSGHSSGSGSSALATWSNTFADDSMELTSSGVTENIGMKERIKLMVNGATHYVGVKSISGNSVTVEIASDPQQATLNAGESKMFDTNGDGTYDIKVTVNSVTNGKANVSVEAVSVPITPTTEQNNQVAADVPANDLSSSTGSNNVWYWVIGIVIIVAIVVALVVRKKK